MFEDRSIQRMSRRTPFVMRETRSSTDAATSTEPASRPRIARAITWKTAYSSGEKNLSGAGSWGYPRQPLGNNAPKARRRRPETPPPRTVLRSISRSRRRRSSLGVPFTGAASPLPPDPPSSREASHQARDLIRGDRGCHPRPLPSRSSASRAILGTFKEPEMPIYKCCNQCRKKVSILTLRISEKVDERCEHCGSTNLTRLLSRFPPPAGRVSARLPRGSLEPGRPRRERSPQYGPLDAQDGQGDG